MSETKATIDLTTAYLSNIARLLAVLPTADVERHVRACQESLERAESIGCLLDPTAYLNASDSLDDARRQLAIAKHLLAARRAIDEREKFVKASGGDGMSQTQEAVGHTPGPWVATEQPDVPGVGSLFRPWAVDAADDPDAGGEWQICILDTGLSGPVRDDHDQLFVDKTAANARLIAAAPDLISACQFALRCFSMFYPKGSEGDSELLQSLRSAIAKATEPCP